MSTIEVRERTVSLDTHGTSLKITKLRNTIVGRQVEVLKKSLTSMYRADLRSENVVLELNGERLQYLEPVLYQEVLPNGLQTYRKDFAIDVVEPNTGVVHLVSGWVGIRDTISRKESGFALLRRGRIIIGGYDAGWRPAEAPARLEASSGGA